MYKRNILILFSSLFYILLFGNNITEVEQLLHPDNDRIIYKVTYFQGEYIDDEYTLLHNYQNPERSIGDCSSSFSDEECTTRWYQEYPFIEFPEDLILESVILKMYQGTAIGNNMINEYPTFYGQELPLKIAVVDYDFSDLHASFFPEEMREVGYLSHADANIEPGWKEVDITTSYQNSRYLYEEDSFKLMFYFDTIGDFDDCEDTMSYQTSFELGNNIGPRLIFNFINPVANDNHDCETTNLEFTCYPNPTVSDISVKANEGQYIENIEVFNLRGQRVFSKQLSGSKSSNVEIKLPKTVSAGVYLVKSRITDGKSNKNLTRKIVVK